jgi:hypothetical protein
MIKSEIIFFAVMLVINIMHWILTIFQEGYSEHSRLFQIFASSFIVSGLLAGLSVFCNFKYAMYVQVFLFIPPSVVLVLLAISTKED